MARKWVDWMLVARSVEWRAASKAATLVDAKADQTVDLRADLRVGPREPQTAAKRAV